MGNWVKVSKEEIDKGLTLINLKKGELQIELVKALVKLDKLKYLIKEYRDEEEEYIQIDYVEEILNEGEKE